MQIQGGQEAIVALAPLGKEAIIFNEKKDYANRSQITFMFIFFFSG